VITRPPSRSCCGSPSAIRTTPTGSAGLSVSHNCVGRVYEAEGRLADALREFEDDLAIAERLAAHDPTSIQWQKDLVDTRSSVDRVRKELRPQP
jgi:hypothetical protein